MTPAQIAWLCASLCAWSLGIATIFWFLGAVLVLPLAWLELAAIGIAFLAYARHAAGGERIWLRGRRPVLAQEIRRALREGAGQPRGDSGRIE